MSKIQLLKEPGYIYDLNFIFCLNFNLKLYTELYLPDGQKKEDTVKYFNDVLEHFGEIPDDLYVFFHAIDTGRAFLPTCYFNPYKNLFATTYNFKFLREQISNYGGVIRNLIKFYFPDLDEEQVNTCAISLNAIFGQIKNSGYSDEQKTKLYEFFIEPERHIQLLQYELMQKDFLLSDYYKDNYQTIIDLYNNTTFEALREQLKNREDLHIDDNREVLYVSFCLLNKYCVSVWFPKDGILPLLGCEYMSLPGYVKNLAQIPNLYAFGTALCEESRVRILNFVIEREEITCKDLEKEFDFSGSTAYHHISIMTKSGLIQTRNEGKTVLYSLNKRYVTNIISTLNKLLTRKG